jgi:hypothetical protein
VPVLDGPFPIVQILNVVRDDLDLGRVFLADVINEACSDEGLHSTRNNNEWYILGFAPLHEFFEARVKLDVWSVVRLRHSKAKVCEHAFPQDLLAIFKRVAVRHDAFQHFSERIAERSVTHRQAGAVNGHTGSWSLQTVWPYFQPDA